MNHFVNTPEGADKIAKFIALPIIGKEFGDGSVILIDWLSKNMDKTLGVAIPGAATKDTPDNPQVQSVPFKSKLTPGASSRIIDW